MAEIDFIGSADSWYLGDIRRAAGEKHCIRQLDYDQLASNVAIFGRESATTVNCHGDAALVRSMSPGSLEQVIFRMDALAQLENAGVYVLNSPRAMETAIDKYLATSRLANVGLPTPPTHVSQSWQSAMRGFHELRGDVVVKPLFGGEGRGITRVSDPDLAERAFKMLTQMGAVVYQQQFVPHAGGDLRVLLLGEKAWGMRRASQCDWRTNVSRGATASPFPVSDDLLAMARRAADVVGAVFAGVDILDGLDGTRYVLEVNAVPGWKALSKALDVDIAAEVLLHIEQAVRR